MSIVEKFATKVQNWILQSMDQGGFQTANLNSANYYRGFSHDVIILKIYQILDTMLSYKEMVASLPHTQAPPSFPSLAVPKGGVVELTES